MFDKLWNSICDGASWFRARMENIESSAIKHIEDNLEPAVSTPSRKVLTGSILVGGIIVADVMMPWLVIGAGLAVAVWHSAKRVANALENRKEGDDSAASMMGQEALLIAVDTVLFTTMPAMVGIHYISEGLDEALPAENEEPVTAVA